MKRNKRKENEFSNKLPWLLVSYLGRASKLRADLRTVGMTMSDTGVYPRGGGGLSGVCVLRLVLILGIVAYRSPGI